MIRRDGVEDAPFSGIRGVECAFEELDALAQALNEAKTFMVHRCFHHLKNVVRVGVSGARHKGGAGGNRLLHRVDRVIDCSPDIGLALKAEGRGGRCLFLGQAIDPVIHDHVRHLDILAGGVIKMIASDGESIPVAAEDEQVQIRARKRNAAGKGQGATVNIVRAVGLDEIGKSARTTNPCDRGDLFVPQFAFFNEFEIQRQH